MMLLATMISRACLGLVIWLPITLQILLGSAKLSKPFKKHSSGNKESTITMSTFVCFIYLHKEYFEEKSNN